MARRWQGAHGSFPSQRILRPLQRMHASSTYTALFRKEGSLARDRLGTLNCPGLPARCPLGPGDSSALAAAIGLFVVGAGFTESGRAQRNATGIRRQVPELRGFWLRRQDSLGPGWAFSSRPRANDGYMYAVSDGTHQDGEFDGMRPRNKSLNRRGTPGNHHAR